MACGQPQERGCLSESEYDIHEASLRELADYDALGRLVRLERTGTMEGRVFEDYLEEYSYVDGKLVREAGFQNATSVEYRHAYRGGLLVETVELSARGVEVDRTYAYDEEGRVVEETSPSSGTVTSYRYEQDRLVEVLQVDADGEVLTTTEIVYLDPPPSRDADIYIQSTVGASHRHDEYDGDLLTGRTTFDEEGNMVFDQRWTYRGDGQVAAYWYTAQEESRLSEYDYDADGHRVARRSGPDADEDGVLDDVTFEQLWTWTCW